MTKQSVANNWRSQRVGDFGLSVHSLSCEESRTSESGAPCKPSDCAGAKNNNKRSGAARDAVRQQKRERAALTLSTAQLE